MQAIAVLMGHKMFRRSVPLASSYSLRQIKSYMWADKTHGNIIGYSSPSQWGKQWALNGLLILNGIQ